MSEENVMILSAKETFSVHGLESKLAEMGYPAVYVPLEMDALSFWAKKCEIIVYYMEPNTSIDMKFTVYLKDLCMEKEKKLILIGRKEEYEDVIRVIPEYVITAWFERPLDMNKFLETIKDQFRMMSLLSQRKTILIVDDDVSYMQMIREWLKDSYQVVMVNSGIKAIRWLITSKADLVLLDYEMPVTTGPQILEMLKSDTDAGEVPVMFLTGQHSKQSVLTAMKLKPVDYLLKTITRTQLRSKLDNYFTLLKAGKSIR